MLKKKIWANFQRIIELFTQKIVTKQSDSVRRDRQIGRQSSDYGTQPNFCIGQELQILGI
jgi:hypothetical protein